MTDPWKVDSTIANIERNLTDRKLGPGKLYWIPCSPERAYLVWERGLSADKRFRLMYSQGATPEIPLAQMPIVIRLRMYTHLPAFHRWTVATVDEVNTRSQETG